VYLYLIDSDPKAPNSGRKEVALEYLIVSIFGDLGLGEPYLGEDPKFLLVN